MKRLVLDTESDGLYWEATRIWCICTKDLDTKETLSYDVERDNIREGVEAIMGADEIICHNVLGHDLPLLDKLGYDVMGYKGLVFDTMIFSQILNPERYKHSLEYFGEKLRIAKPEHEDWSQYTPEMLHRCKIDVDINEATYHYLMREAGENIEGVRLWSLPVLG